MNKGSSKDTNLTKQEHRSISASKEDSKADQVKPLALIHEADTSAQPIASIIETNCSVYLTTRTNEAEFSSERTTPMDEASIPVQPPTFPMDGADIPVKPMYPNNIADKNIVAYLTSRIKEVDISVQPTVQTNEPDIYVQPTVTVDVANRSGQPTVQLDDVGKAIHSFQEADASVHPTDVINKADLSPTEGSEEYQEAYRIFKWIEKKLDLLKLLQGSEENKDCHLASNEHRIVSLNDKRNVLEEMLKEIRNMTSGNVPRKAGDLSKDVTRMLDMLQETTLGFLDSLNKSKSSCLSIKVLATLILHLSASIGSKVKFQDVQTCINGKRVLQLYSEVQSEKELRHVKMATVERYLVHGINKAQALKRKSQSHKRRVDWTISECTGTIYVRSANENLKALTKVSEDLLLKYADSISYLMTKAKSFVTVKNDSDRVLSFFMTKEIQDLYKE